MALLAGPSGPACDSLLSLSLQPTASFLLTVYPTPPTQRTLHQLALSALLYAPSQISGKVGIPCTTIRALGKPGCHPSLSAQTPPQPFSAQAASVD